MKNLSLNIKKIALGLMVAFLAVGFSAFTNAEKGKLATDWYAPLDPNLSESNPLKNSFSSYNSTPLESEPMCNQDEYVCAARFPNTSAAPTQIVYINH